MGHGGELGVGSRGEVLSIYIIYIFFFSENKQALNIKKKYHLKKKRQISSNSIF